MKKYRVGAIGTGWAALNPLPTFKTYAGSEVVAICSGRIERARATAEKFGAPLAFDDYHELIDHPDVDIVYVCTPVILHAPMVLAAAAAGKPILCEKPLSANVQQGREMLDAVERGRVPNVVAFTLRHFPWSIYVKQLIDEGVLGDVQQVVITQFRADPPPSFNLEQQVRAGGGAPPRGWTWLADAEQGGGAIGSMGSHYIDIVRHFCGEFADIAGRTRTLRTSMTDEQGVERPVTAEDTFAFYATLRNGAMVTLQFGGAAVAGIDRRLEFFGSRGAIVLNGDNELLVARDGGPLTQVPIPTPAFSEAVASSHSPRFALMIEKLIGAIESGEPTSPDIRDGYACQQVIDALKLSSKERRTVDLTPA
jgi:predicted dehydrogenase